MNDPRKRHCHVCGKPLTCDCYYADYGLVKLDGCGHTYIEFDACPDCLNKVLVAMKQALIFNKEEKPMPNQFTEIERKFLLDSFPTDLPLKEEFQVYQAYLSIDPEVRIRRNVKNGEDTAYYLAIKSSGELVRTEVELPISKDHFYALAEMVSQPFITKDFHIYGLPNGLVMECSHVDKGMDTEFMYAEVEFPSVKDAEEFELLPCLKEDVTNDSSYKMKNFWKRTRG